MFRFGNRAGTSPKALLAIGFTLIAFISGAYLYHGISFGFTILILGALALALLSTLRSVKPQEQDLRRTLKAIAAIALAVAIVLTGVHLLHK